MRLLFTLIGLLGFSLSATAEKGWLFYDTYPWVYDHKTKDWLYLRGAADGTIYAYRNSTKQWDEFTPFEKILNTPSGRTVVDKISGRFRYRDLAGLTNWTVYETNTGWRIQTGYHDDEGNSYSAIGAFDQLPSSGFSQSEYAISDDGVYIWNPNGYALYYEIESVEDGVVTSNYGPYGAASLSKSYFFISKDKAEEFYNPLAWNEQYEEWVQNPEPYGGLSVLEQIKEAKDSGAMSIWLGPSGIGIYQISNNISDLTPLAELTNLEWLELGKNNISDLTPLTGLTNLTNLELYINNISDLSPLAGLTNLTVLTLADNNISDITPLTGLTNLTGLHLGNDFGGNNNISDLSPLAGLTNLTGLNLNKNNISDLTPLAGLTNLEVLYLSGNNITDITPLAGLTNLTFLYLDQNNISDLTPLAGLTNLTVLWLENINLITASQKAMLEEALPNTIISWPEVIIEDELTRSAKTAKLEIFTDSLDWEAIFKSRNDYVYTNYSVIDDGFSTGDFRVSISAYDPNYPSIQTTSNTSVDIRNYRSDENGDGIYDILDPDIFYQGSFTGTESGTYYNNNSYLGNVVLETLFNATRSPGQTFLRAEIYATVTSSSIPEIQVGQSFSIDRDYYTLSWSGTLDYDSTSYQASFSDNQTKVGYSANSQITQTNESSITLKNFSLPNSLGTTTNTDISLTKKGDIFHKQFLSNGITYYFRVLDIVD